jgi:hypothetical protein
MIVADLWLIAAEKEKAYQVMVAPQAHQYLKERGQLAALASTDTELHQVQF